MLLERTRELRQVHDLLDLVTRGGSGALLVEAHAGIGKTSLLSHAIANAQASGLTVLTAAGGELERDLPFGVAVQLFEHSLQRASDSHRDELLAGAAALAGPVLHLQHDGSSAQPTSQAAALHGLYWLCANMSDRGPLLLCVDDLHWCDEESVRWLSYLVRRLDGLRLGLLATTRPAEPGAAHELIAHFASQPGVRVVSPAPLTQAASALLVSELAGEPAEAAFSEACHVATGGNPLLLRELGRALADEHITPVADNAGAVGRIAPVSVTQGVLRRLGRLSDDATALARAVAVMGSDGTLREAAGVAGVSAERATDLADALVRGGIFAADADLGFAHPVIRTAVYADMPHALRTSIHEKVAALLTEADVGPEAVAQHVLAIPRSNDARHVAILRAAAAEAARRGAPEAAIRFLGRALVEPLHAERGSVLHELGLLEATIDGPAAVEHLHEALAAAEGPLERGRVALSLAQTLAAYGRGHEVADVIDGRAMAEIAGADPDLAMRLQAELVNAGATYEPSRRGWVGDGPVPSGRTLGERELLTAMCFTAKTATESIDLGERAIGHGHLLPEQLGGLGALFYALLKLINCGRHEIVAGPLAEALADARARGSLYETARFSYLRALLFLRAGQIAEAAADARFALDGAMETGSGLGVASSLAVLLDCVRERGDWEAGLAAIAEVRPARWEMAVGATLLGASRGRFELARGNLDAALATLLELEPIAEALPSYDAQFLEVRPTLARIYAARGDRARAVATADRACEAARQWGHPRSVGVALMAAGLAVGGDEGTALLASARAELAGAGDALAQAHACVELGAALRRAGRRVDSREPLRAGLDIGARCGATVLTARAQDELRATGARPRRVQLNGIDALTPSELRVAKLAAAGASNRDIAQNLFVTVKTVELHLMRSYQKLGISSRNALPDALSGQGAAGER